MKVNKKLLRKQARESRKAEKAEKVPDAGDATDEDDDDLIVSAGQVSRFHTRLESSMASLGTEVDLKDITLEVAGKQLLRGARLNLLPGRRYGLVGRNGVGKTTLLRQIAKGKLVGFPPHIRTLLVDQDDVGSTHKTPLQIVMESDAELGHLLAREHLYESALRDAEEAAAGGSVAARWRAARALITAASEDALWSRTDAKMRAERLSGARGKAARDEFVEVEAAVARILAVRKAVRACESEHGHGEDIPPADVEKLEEVIDGCVRAFKESKTEGADGVDDPATLAAQELCAVREALTAHGGREEAEGEASKILRGLGFAADSLETVPTSHLSGGWRMRVAIARALFADADLLMLDEPSNHLDLKAVLWLEKWILDSFSDGGARSRRRSSSTPTDESRQRVLVIVSHDRSFLDAVCTDIVQVARETLHYFPGNLSEYEETVEEANAHKAKLIDSINRREQAMKKSIEWMLAKARESGDDKRLKQVTSRRRKLEERTGMEKNAHGHRFKLNRDRIGYFTTRRDDVRDGVQDDARPPALTLPCGDCLGTYGALLQLDEVAVGYGEGASARSILDKVSLNVDMTSRIGVMGVNGSGKSTLLKCLAGQLDPLKGRRLAHRNLRVGYLTQDLVDEVDKTLSPMELLGSYGGANKGGGLAEEHHLRAQLAHFGLSGNTVLRPLSTLSGGQRARACIAAVTLAHPHILLVDEPTNHLDLETVEALALALNEYKGGLVLVSHDRWLLEQCADQLYHVAHVTASPAAAPATKNQPVARSGPGRNLKAAGTEARARGGGGEECAVTVRLDCGGDGGLRAAGANALLLYEGSVDEYSTAVLREARRATA